MISKHISSFCKKNLVISCLYSFSSYLFHLPRSQELPDIEQQIIDILLTATSLMDENGRPAEIATIERDISELKQFRKAESG